MHTILITGANGFIGHYLSELLLQRNHRVIATGKGPCRLPFTHPQFRYEPLDFEDEQQVASLLQQYRPDVVVHGGAISKPDVCEKDREGAYRTNVTGTLHLLQQAALLQSFFLFISTDFVFSGEKETYTEEDATGPVNYYGQTKVLAEDAVKNYPFSWSIVRPILVYGAPRSGRDNILTNVAVALKRGENLSIFTDQLRTPTFVEDLVAGMVQIIERQATGIYHLSGADQLTPYQMACAAADHLGLDSSRIRPVTADFFAQPAKRPPRTVFDLSKAQKDLGYQATPFSEGLKRTFK
ncbi:SDR family oxidoreductase [Paraflavisolibacter sp. H34]|uniref:SDR family oxidoreductase n=1 Tax=Huijunlia imazamoxiresistens TaxID=3127457 RepID=UPI00301B5268